MLHCQCTCSALALCVATECSTACPAGDSTWRPAATVTPSVGTTTLDLVDGHQRLPMLLPALHYEPMALGVSAPPAGADAWLLGSDSACRGRAKVLMKFFFLKWIHYWRLLMITVSLLPHYCFITSSLLPHYFLLLQITSIRSG